MSPCGMIFTPLEPATGIIATENSMKKTTDYDGKIIHQSITVHPRVFAD